MPEDERILEVGAHHLGIAREPLGIEARAEGEARSHAPEHARREHAPAREVLREGQRGSRGDRARDLRRALAQQRRQDQPAHAVADELEAEPGVLGADRGEHLAQVVEKVVEALHVGADAVGTAVSLVIVGVHGAAARREPGAQVLVAPRMLGEAVDEQEKMLGVGRQPAASEERAAARRRERRLDPADHAGCPGRAPGRGGGDLLLAQDSACRSTASRAARTRAR